MHFYSLSNFGRESKCIPPSGPINPDVSSAYAYEPPSASKVLSLYDRRTKVSKEPLSLCKQRVLCIGGILADFGRKFQIPSIPPFLARLLRGEPPNPPPPSPATLRRLGQNPQWRSRP